MTFDAYDMPDYSKESSFKPTDLGQIITEYAVVVCAHDDNDLMPHGSGFFIFPRLVVTARHVIAHFLEHLHGIDQPRGHFDILSRIQVFQFVGEEAKFAIWDVRRGWCAYQNDIAFLAVEPANDVAAMYTKWRRLLLCATPPDVGERIQAFGYPASSGKTEIAEGSFRTILNVSPHTSVGEVREVYLDRRDSVMLPFPCFQTNARFDGGMSGGPVFNSKGQVCGMICAGVDGDDGSEHCTYAATLWPAFLTRIDFKGEGYTFTGSYKVSSMVEKGLIAVTGWDTLKPLIEFDFDSEGNPIPRLRSP